MRSGSKSFVKEDEFGKVGVAWNAQDFEIAPLNFDFAELASWRGLAHEMKWRRGAHFL